MTLSLNGGSWYNPEDPGEPTTGKPRLSVTDDEANILTAIATGRSVLEIGTGLGVSTRALAVGAHYVYTVDVDPWVEENVVSTLPHNVTFRNSVDKLPPAAFDVAFIDGDHNWEAVRADVDYATKVCSQLIVCHDANYIDFDESWLKARTEHGLAFKVL